MNVIIGGIDYSTADIAAREKFSLTNSKKEAVYGLLNKNKDIYGSVIISTCNRVEIYLSLREGTVLHPLELLCSEIGLDFTRYRHTCKKIDTSMSFEHLCKLSSGALSQIFGEDQIITQVKESLDLARACKATDSILEVFFRTAIACAKKIRTDINLAEREVSVSGKVIEKIETEKLPIKKMLVIGNGAMGRRAAEDLMKHGISVTMTTRSYRHKDNKNLVIPEGTQLIDYHKRYEYIEQFDGVVSATLSPHFTLTKEGLAGLEKIPKYYFDLAIPRDIEEGISAIAGVQVFNIDELSSDKKGKRHHEQLEQMAGYILKYKADLYKWEAYRNLNKQELIKA